MALGLLGYSSNSRDYGNSETPSKECCSASGQDKRTKNYQLV